MRPLPWVHAKVGQHVGIATEHLLFGRRQCFSLQPFCVGLLGLVGAVRAGQVDGARRCSRQRKNPQRRRKPSHARELAIGDHVAN